MCVCVTDKSNVNCVYVLNGTSRIWPPVDICYCVQIDDKRDFNWRKSTDIWWHFSHNHNNLSRVHSKYWQVNILHWINASSLWKWKKKLRRWAFQLINAIFLPFWSQFERIFGVIILKVNFERQPNTAQEARNNQLNKSKECTEANLQLVRSSVLFVLHLKKLKNWKKNCWKISDSWIGTSRTIESIDLKQERELLFTS